MAKKWLNSLLQVLGLTVATPKKTAKKPAKKKVVAKKTAKKVVAKKKPAKKKKK